MIGKIISTLGVKKFYIYTLIGAVIVSFFGGAYIAWKIKGALQTSKNMKVIERDVEIIEDQNEIDAISYDSDSFRNGILRAGRL